MSGVTNNILDHELKLSRDAFAHSQIISKLEACRAYEKNKINAKGVSILIYGGWYGTLANMLFIRGNIDISCIRSYDIDPYATKMANALNEAWLVEERFQAVCGDANDVKPLKGEYTTIINTSTEHFHKLDWWHNIPKGQQVLIQGNNLPHIDHHQTCESLEDFTELYPFYHITKSQTLEFEYSDLKFERYLILGYK